MAMKSYPPPIVFGTLDAEGLLMGQAQKAIKANCASIKVLFDQITLGPGTYTEDEAEPQPAKGNKWVAWKLNQLGWFAGPVDAADDKQLRRAVRRYTFAHPGLDATDDPADGKLQAALQAGEEPRPLVDTDGALAWTPDKAPPAEAKVVIDHDLYVVNRTDGEDKSPPKGEAMRPDGLQWLEAKRLDRFEAPLEVTVHLQDAKGKGVLVPEALEGLSVRWQVLEVDGNCPVSRGGAYDKDRPNVAHFVADATSLPPYATTNPSGDEVLTAVVTGKGKAQDYKKRGKAGVLFRGSYQGGDVFKVRAELAVPDALRDHLRREHPSWDKRMVATTASLKVWRRCRVAGDLVVGAISPKSVDWAGVSKAFEPAHLELVPPAAKDTPAWTYGSMTKAKYRDAVAAKDDAQPADKKLTRLTFQVLDPTDVNKAATIAATVDNDPITPCKKFSGEYVADFRSISYIRGETSGAHGKIFAKSAGKSAWVIHVHAIDHDVVDVAGKTTAEKAVKDKSGAPATLQAGEFFQIGEGPGGPFRRAGKLLTADTVRAAAVVVDDHISYLDVEATNARPEAEYLALLHQDGVNSLYKGGGYDFGPLFGLGQALHESRPDKRPGVIVVRAVQTPGAKADSALRTTKPNLFREGTSIGLDHGLVLLDAQQFFDYDDVFLVSHEVGHTLYLTHTFDVKTDHDDDKCMMNYPKNTGGLGKRGGSNPRFCGKCVQKLQGWRVQVV